MGELDAPGRRMLKFAQSLGPKLIRWIFADTHRLFFRKPFDCIFEQIKCANVPAAVFGENSEQLGFLAAAMLYAAACDRL